MLSETIVLLTSISDAFSILKYLYFSVSVKVNDRIGMLQFPLFKINQMFIFCGGVYNIAKENEDCNFHQLGVSCISSQISDNYLVGK